ncbi:LPXTG cell wall anchor domain-containing protein [Periweissella cryptocerci]|uniref:LPXTG cell wall anchor domain-containing protein n=1 Tax=Periweissella cryptocerci TaxID=2506420 RepID=A0A4V1AIL3_9LACO|nr:leucine-rich repeat protein [Periweissella cryptocerci]QBO35905.1 LPXTG cell wall anchor domain-containing protein [Periweissella cryptocerci]
MIKEKESHHNIYKLTEHLNGKHFLYAGLATTTLIGGMGATPLALADKADSNQTELVNKVAPKKNKNKSKKASRTWADGGDTYDFTADDFDVEDGVITGFSQSFFDDYLYTDDCHWDGAVTFPAEFATTITGISNDAFRGSQMRTIDLNALTALETIGEHAFADSYALESVDISNLEHLVTIDAGAFYNCTGLEAVNLSNLPVLEMLGQRMYGDDYYDDDSIIDDSDYYNNSFNWSIPGVFQSCENIKSVTFDGLSALRAIPNQLFYDCINIETITFNNLAKLKNIETNSITGTTGLKTLTLTNLPNLVHIDSYIYYPNWDYGNLNQIIIGNVNSALIVEAMAFELPAPGGIVIPVDGVTDLQSAQKFMPAINGTGANSGNLLGNEKWHIGSAISYKFIDQDGQVITAGIDNTPVKAFTISGKVGSKYDLPKLPTIAGYGNPALVSGTETGTFGYGLQEVVYQYQAATASIMIYRVDTNDKNLVEPETVTGFANDTLDLDDKQLAINGYDFQELNISTLSRAVGAYTWQAAPDSVGKSLTLGANAGRSYKFVYAKTATPAPTPDQNNSNTNNNNTTTNNNSSTGSSASSSSEKPAASSSSTTSSSTSGKNDNSKATSSSTQDPNALPSTGGNSTGTSGIGNNRTTTSRSSNTRYIPLSTDTPHNMPTSIRSKYHGKSLPQSGVIVNRVLPAIGAIALASVIGLYAISKKKRKY